VLCNSGVMLVSPTPGDEGDTGLDERSATVAIPESIAIVVSWDGDPVSIAEVTCLGRCRSVYGRFSDTRVFFLFPSRSRPLDVWSPEVIHARFRFSIGCTAEVLCNSGVMLVSPTPGDEGDTGLDERSATVAIPESIAIVVSWDRNSPRFCIQNRHSTADRFGILSATWYQLIACVVLLDSLIVATVVCSTAISEGSHDSWFSSDMEGGPLSLIGSRGRNS